MKPPSNLGAVFKLRQQSRMAGVAARQQRETKAVDGWQPIETAPKTGRVAILLKTPYNSEGCPAYSDTWWTAGFSVECKPTHWKPRTETQE